MFIGAIGGGAEIAMAADFRVMSPNSKIGFVHGKMGLTPAWGGASRLVEVFIIYTMYLSFRFVRFIGVYKVFILLPLIPLTT